VGRGGEGVEGRGWRIERGEQGRGEWAVESRTGMYPALPSTLYPLQASINA